jgi:hypothetical protein
LRTALDAASEEAKEAERRTAELERVCGELRTKVDALKKEEEGGSLKVNELKGALQYSQDALAESEAAQIRLEGDKRRLKAAAEAALRQRDTVVAGGEAALAAKWGELHSAEASLDEREADRDRKRDEVSVSNIEYSV